MIKDCSFFLYLFINLIYDLPVSLKITYIRYIVYICAIYFQDWLLFSSNTKCDIHYEVDTGDCGPVVGECMA